MFFTSFMLGLLYVAFAGVLIWLLGGNWIFALVLVGGLAVFQYYSSDKLALRAAGAKVIAREDDPHLSTPSSGSRRWPSCRCLGAGPVGILRLLEELFVRPGDLISAYPNAGRPEFYEGRYLYHPTAQYFADNVPSLIAQKPRARLIGGCCGTTPETIQAMAPRLVGQLPVSSKRGKVLVDMGRLGGAPQLPLRARSSPAIRNSR